MALGPHAVQLERSAGRDVFIDCARALAVGGNRTDAAAFARNRSPRAAEIFARSGGIAGALTVEDLGTPAQAFLNSLSNVGAFDKMYSAMLPVPVKKRIVVATMGATGSAVAEGEVAPISQIELAGNTLSEKKVVAMLVTSRELAEMPGNAGADLFGRELSAAVASATDAEFINLITAGATPIGSTVSTAAAARADLSAALAAVGTDQSSKLFILMRSETAKALALQGTEAGFAFPQMTPTGGVIAGKHRAEASPGSSR